MNLLQTLNEKSIFMKSLFTCILSLSLTATVVAQDVSLPKDIKLEQAADYKQTEALVIKAIDWLANTPINEDADKRKELSAFLMKWVNGSPTVSIALVPDVAPLDSKDCLLAFMAGWTKYSLQNNYAKDNVACAVAAAEHTINFYNKNKATLGNSKTVELLIKKQKSNKLNKYIASIYEDLEE